MPIIEGPDKKYPKSIASIIIAGRGSKEPIGETEEVLAAKDFLAACDSKDAARLLRSFKVLYALCEKNEHEIMGEEDESY